MRFGFHISIAGGFSKVVGRAKTRNCETIQIFSRNPRGWKSTPLDEKDVAAFRAEVAKSTISPVFVHLPYLPNLATRRSPFYNRSLGVLVGDLVRSETLSAPYLIMHMGSRLDSSRIEAVNTLAESINHAFCEVDNRTILVLENTSGQGTQIGSSFEEMGLVMQEVADQSRLGVCLDTAHAYGAGYDISNRKGLDQTLHELDRFIGLERLLLVHLNDTKVPLGSGHDRHWHIGEGNIGLEGFRNIVNHPCLSHLPGIMETPRKNDDMDLKNMSVIRGLINNKDRP
ncbi:MAG: deoxyribonuclease IV [Proteobacteria bacterium]|nr:deoxyribonuclease IV [Pseudomonadota bacterium]NIS69617.1 deoxyribonuclease IV [Pseudomonadota bacterium]